MKYKTLINGISEDRLKAYLSVTNGDEDAAAILYRENLEICSIFYNNLHWVEITLRNAVNRELSISYGLDWYNNPNLGFGEIETSKIEKAKDLLQKEDKIINNANIVAGLTFGFWASLFNGRYENIWRYSLRKSFKTSGVILKRRDVSSRLHPLLKLRNRVAHYEPIIRHNLDEYEKRINDLISWIEPEFLNELKHYK